VQYSDKVSSDNPRGSPNRRLAICLRRLLANGRGWTKRARELQIRPGIAGAPGNME
jgi:hypothetical protein